MRPIHRCFSALVLVSILSGCTAAPVQALREPQDGSRQTPAAPATASDYAANVDVLALGYSDGSFEVRSPAPLHVLSRGRHEAPVVNVALSKDARRLASVDAAGNVAVSTIEDGTLEMLADIEVAPHETGAGEPTLGLAWDATGQRLALASGTLVRVVDLQACSSQETQLPSPAGALAFAPDGTQLVAAGREVLFLSLPSLSVHQRLATPKGTSEQTGVVTDLGFSPDGRALALTTLGGVAILDVVERRFEFAALHDMKPRGLRFAEDGRIAVFGRGSVYAGDPVPSRIEAGTQTTRGRLTHVDFRRDGSLLVVGEGVEEELAALLETKTTAPSE